MESDQRPEMGGVRLFGEEDVGAHAVRDGFSLGYLRVVGRETLPPSENPRGLTVVDGAVTLADAASPVEALASLLVPPSDKELELKGEGRILTCEVSA